MRFQLHYFLIDPFVSHGVVNEVALNLQFLENTVLASTVA